MTALVVDVPSVARRIGILTTPTAEQASIIEDAISDAQADVAAYIGCPIVPSIITVTVQPWDNLDAAVRRFYPVTSTNVTPNVDGSVTLTVAYGYDAANDETMEPVRRYIRYATLQQPRIIDLWRKIVGSAGSQRIKSASADGQSVSYDQVTPTGEVIMARQSSAGTTHPGLPTLASLDYWRVAGRRVSKADAFASDPLPLYPQYTSAMHGWW